MDSSCCIPVVVTSCMLVNHGPSQQSSKKNTSHGNEVLLQDTIHLIQRPCYKRGSLCQDPAGNWTTQRPPDDHKETQTAVVWSCLPFIRPGQNHLARHSKRGKTTRQTEEEVGRHQGMDRPGVWQVPEGSGKYGKMEKTGCKIICGAQMTVKVKAKKKKSSETECQKQSTWLFGMSIQTPIKLTNTPFTQKLMARTGHKMIIFCMTVMFYDKTVLNKVDMASWKWAVFT